MALHRLQDNADFQTVLASLVMEQSDIMNRTLLSAEGRELHNAQSRVLTLREFSTMAADATGWLQTNK